MATTTKDFTSVVYGNKHLQSGLHKSKEFVKSFVDGNIAISYQNKVLQSVPADVLRIFAQSKKIASENIFHNMLMNYLLMAEKKCPGASLPFVLSLLQDDLIIKRSCSRTTEEFVWKALQSYVGYGQIFEVVKETIQRTGYVQKLDFVLRDCDRITVNIKNTEQVKCSIDPIFGNLQSTLIDAIMICVEGKIESVGEIDALLNWSNTEERAIILLAHEYSPDVANTLKKNFDSGNTRVVPFVFNGYNKNNDLREFSLNLKMPLVSTQTGLRFSNLKLDDILPINECIVDGCYLHIESEYGANRTAQIMIPHRLKAIAGILEDRIKCGLLIVKNSARFGVTKLESISGTYYVPNNVSEFFKPFKSSWDKNLESIECSIFVHP